MGYRFVPYHTLNRNQLAPPLRLVNPIWTEVVNGVGQLTGTITAPKNDDALQQVLLATEPDEAAIYVFSEELNELTWGGPVVQQEWDPENGTIRVTALSWRSWMYNAFLPPDLDPDLGDIVYSWTQVDQLQIARDITAFVTPGFYPDGKPEIMVGSEMSGKLRDLNFKGLDFKYAGEAIDSMAQRSGGFEWDIIPRTDAIDRLPRLTLALYFPERGGSIDGLLMKRTREGGNLKLEGVITKTTFERRTRVWTTGVTESPQYAVDSDPAMAEGNILLREKSTSHSTVTERTTLASHARAERVFLGPKTSMLEVSLPEGSPHSSTYRAGDRGRLVYQDRVYDLDMDAVRIVERRLAPDDGAGRVKLLLDLSDVAAPEVDIGGAV